MAIGEFVKAHGPGNLQYWGDAPPSRSDGFAVGDVIWNHSPSDVDALFWMKTPSGWTGIGGVYTYFVDAERGSDHNEGRSSVRAWKSTELADAVELLPGQKVGYKQDGEWVLYRSVDMTVDQWDVTLDVVTAPMDSF